MVPYYQFIEEMCERFGIRFFNSFLQGSQEYTWKSDYTRTSFPSMFHHDICLLTWPSWMSAFGHRSAKPSRGWGNASVPHICVLWGGAFDIAPVCWVGSWKGLKRGSLKSLIDWLRPYIPRLFLRMTLKLRKKLGLSSSGVTIKKKDPKTGKVTVSLATWFSVPPLCSYKFWVWHACKLLAQQFSWGREDQCLSKLSNIQVALGVLWAFAICLARSGNYKH